jgi:hypothetical protein
MRCLTKYVEHAINLIAYVAERVDNEKYQNEINNFNLMQFNARWFKCV